MQIAAHDAGKLSRAAAGGAGLAVAAFGALTLATSTTPVSPAALVADPAPALLPAGLALFLSVLPAPPGPLRHTGYALAGLTAALGAVLTVRHPAAGVATALAGLALTLVDVRVGHRADAALRFRVADPLVAGAAVIALVALVPRMFAPAFPSGRAPDGVMSPYLAAALLTLSIGTVLARPEAGPLRTSAAAGPGTTIRRSLPLAVAVPVLAALVSALAVRTGMGRPVAAISTGAILAGLAVLALVGYLVRSLERADRRQRALLAELHDRQEFAETLLQSMNEAVMVLDANHRVIDVNRRWQELAGRPGTDPRGSRPDPLPPTGTGDWLVHRADGTEVPVLATMAAVPDAHGAPRAYVATYVDIADRKRAEEELSEHATELQRSNEQLREANTRLEKALAFKNDLTSMLTHDVAQPISSIASLAELLAADWSDLPDDVRHELATKINRNTHRLIKMMNDLQLLFRLDTGSVTARRTPVPLLEVLRNVAEGAADPEVRISVEENLSALADRGHLTAVVQNLLANAIAYGQTPVEIRACRDADTVVLEVRDHGPGIPDELLPRLFDRFMRGSGLGLFIVRHLVEANGGSVHYAHAEPHGARLIVTLESASLPA
ncbi:sensor histidine kinase [Jidongwangia harbinensis]|uniref:sensor histidine kinase n=1 Tax=Jidongwangia harbinensis TaxID=2878561 RepID=UPI001CDA4433|nr:ATP-binding protein [Jidongwangia harbinensis]MCA2213731.1 PAS domain S-box protein [Jidongwangia harbinensis]